MNPSTTTAVNGFSLPATRMQYPPIPAFPWPDDVEVVLARYERQLLEHALAHADGVKRRAATLLGISRYALERRLRRISLLLDTALPVAANARVNVASAGAVALH